MECVVGKSFGNTELSKRDAQIKEVQGIHTPESLRMYLVGSKIIPLVWQDYVH